MSGTEPRESLVLARSSLVDDREMAARELQKYLPNQSVQTTLLELLGDEDWRVRHASVEALSSADAANVLPPVLQALYDEGNAGKRNAALDVLARFGTRILPYLSAHLQSSNPDVRMFLVTLMGEFQDRDHLQFLQSCLKDPEENLVSAAILALGKLGDPSLTPHLVELLHGKNLWLQFQAIEASGKMQDESLLPHLIPLLQSTYCRSATLKALGCFQHGDAYRILAESAVQEGQCDFDALDSLIRLYHAPQPEAVRRKDQAAIRKSCSDALQGEDREILLHAMEISHPYRQFTIAQFLAWCASDEAIQKLREFENSPEFSDVATRTLFSLGYAQTTIGNEKSRVKDKQSLLQEIKGEDPIIRKRAARLMAKEFRQEFREPLMTALADENPRVRESAAEALRFYPSEEVTEALLSSLQDEDAWTRAAVYKSLPAAAADVLVERLPQEHPVAQVSILRALARTPGEQALMILESHLQHDNPEIRAAVCESFAAFPSRKSILLLKNRFESDPVWMVRVAALKALALTQPPELSVLLDERLRTESEVLVKKEILTALTLLSDGSFSEIVLEFLTDPELTDEAYSYLLSRSPHKAEILERVTNCRPGLRRLVQKIFD